MRFCFLLLSFFIISNSIFSQKPLKINGNKTNYLSIGKTNVFANKYEVSNGDYDEFLTWLKKNKGESEYAFYLPDTLIWRTPLGYSEKYVKYYFRHPAYRNYPVIGINYEQAIGYCQWLTETQNNGLSDSYIKKIVFRLPTEKEWEIAAKGGLSEDVIFPWGSKSTKVSKGKYLGAFQANYLESNYNIISNAGHLLDGSDITDTDKSYWPNGFGLYQMAGNVAEMVTEKSICKGGAWSKPAYKMVISNRDTMDKSENWVGFRVFAEIEEYKIPSSEKKLDAKFIENQVVRIPYGGVEANGYKNIFEDTSDIIIEGGFYISTFEVSNELYIEFLNSINDASKRNKYLPQDKNWITETDLLQYQHYSTQFPNYPVVNINKDTMTEFCEWLTKLYNQDSKRKFNEVSFSLPTVKQHIVVSHSGMTFPFYSWGGPYHIDIKGNYLLNYNPLLDYVNYNIRKLDEDIDYRHSQLPILKLSRNLDGHELTAPVNSYNPCSYGVYNLNGNVAEAVSNSDYVFGGSFASMLINCINLGVENPILEKIQLPSTQVGFRFIMKVIKE